MRMDVNNGMKIKKIDNGRELFYGVVAIASFIVMAVGATFAYFTATASSNVITGNMATIDFDITSNFISFSNTRINKFLR